MDMIPVVMKSAEVERPVGGTFGLYSKGKPYITRRGRTGYDGGGWYAQVKRTIYADKGPSPIVVEEQIVSMRAAWGRKTSTARIAVRGMWSTREEAECAALMIVARHPEWAGTLEVRRLVL